MLNNIPYVVCEGEITEEDLHFFTAQGMKSLKQPPGEGPWISRESGTLGLHVRLDGRVVTSAVDFSDPALLHRLKTSGKRQGIGQAVGLNKYTSVDVLDCTAGLGRDAFIMAGLGCKVTMMERHPLIHALLEDGLKRGRQSDNPVVSDICKKLDLVHDDALKWLGLCEKADRPDVIYMDPMFPSRKKTARVKKAISGLKLLTEPDTDFLSLLSLAIVKAGKRIVVKRPSEKNDEWLEGIHKPSFEIPGKTVRFVVFVPEND